MSNGKGNRYSDAVWICLRELYEASPKASIGSICTALEEMLGVPVPGETAVRRRIKSESWEKIASKQCNFSSKTLRKKMQKKYSENNIEVSINEVVNIDLKPSKNRGISAPLTGIQRVYKEKAFLSRKTANVILELRRDNYVIGQYQRNLVSQLIDTEYQLDNFMDYFNSYPSEFESLGPAEAFAQLKDRHNRISRSLGLVESIFSSLEKRAKLDFILYGINQDDTREPDTQKRIMNLEEDEEYYRQQEEISKQKQKDIAERMALLQSGVFEEEVRLEAMNKAKAHEVDVDAEEAEFDEIN